MTRLVSLSDNQIVITKKNLMSVANMLMRMRLQICSKDLQKEAYDKAWQLKDKIKKAEERHA